MPSNVVSIRRPGDRPSPRDAWRDAVWSSDLPPLARLVALAYADHAQAHGRDVWVTTERGVERTGMSRRSWFNALAELRDAGWLAQTQAARSGRDGGRAAEFTLTTPDGMSAPRAPIDEGMSARDDGMSAPDARISAPRAPQPLQEPLQTTPTARATDDRADDRGGVDVVDSIRAAHGNRHDPDVVRRVGKRLAADPSIRDAAALLRSPAGARHLDDEQRAADRLASEKRHSARVAADMAAAKRKRRPPSARFAVARRIATEQTQPGDTMFDALANITA